MIPGLTSPLYTKQKGAINFFHFRVLFDHQNRLIREILTAFETSGPWFKVKLLWKICLSMVSSSLKFKSTYKWFFDCGDHKWTSIGHFLTHGSKRKKKNFFNWQKEEMAFRFTVHNAILHIWHNHFLVWFFPPFSIGIFLLSGGGLVQCAFGRAVLCTCHHYYLPSSQE